MKKINSIFIKNVKYISKSLNKKANKLNDLPFVMIRTYSAGVHFGYLNKKKSTLAGIEVELFQARRVYYWAGAASLSQLAMEGSNKQKDCKIAMPVISIELVAIEIIPITKKAQLNLGGILEWKC